MRGIIIFIFLISCKKTRDLNLVISEKEILCDSIYPNKSYKILLDRISDEKSYHFYKTNTIFKVIKSENRNGRELLRDTIQSNNGNIYFKDFNGDKIKDILVENFEIKGNYTFHLYTVDLKNNRIIKIKNFDDIINPRYLPKYNLIDNIVRTQGDWTSFYIIKKDSIIDFGKEHDIIYWEKEKNGKYKSSSENEYSLLLNKVLEKSKNYK